MSDTATLIAAFAAKGGKVTKVATGATNGMTARGWYKAARDAEVVRVIEEISPVVSVVTDHAGREFYRNEAGEWL